VRRASARRPVALPIRRTNHFRRRPFVVLGAERYQGLRSQNDDRDHRVEYPEHPEDRIVERGVERVARQADDILLQSTLIFVHGGLL
ncbi:hypothetical protein CPZ06_10325, partial [Lactobacillus acidophilus]